MATAPGRLRHSLKSSIVVVMPTENIRSPNKPVKYSDLYITKAYHTWILKLCIQPTFASDKHLRLQPGRRDDPKELRVARVALLENNLALLAQTFSWFHSHFLLTLVLSSYWIQQILPEWVGTSPAKNCSEKKSVSMRTLDVQDGFALLAYSTACRLLQKVSWTQRNHWGCPTSNSCMITDGPRFI